MSKIYENKKCVYATFSVNKVEIRINNHIDLAVDRESSESYIKHKEKRFPKRRGGKWNWVNQEWGWEDEFSCVSFYTFEYLDHVTATHKIKWIKNSKEKKLSDFWKVGWILNILVQVIWKISLTA